jgi:hypothetical protein
MILFLFIATVWWFCGAQIWFSARPGLSPHDKEKVVDYIFEKPLWCFLCNFPGIILVILTQIIIQIYFLFKRL